MSIRVQVNGQERQVEPGTSVAGLLETLQLQPLRVAVEHNRRILRRQEFDSTRLQADDRLEIVHFVGGG